MFMNRNGLGGLFGIGVAMLYDDGMNEVDRSFPRIQYSHHPATDGFWSNNDYYPTLASE